MTKKLLFVFAFTWLAFPFDTEAGVSFYRDDGKCEVGNFLGSIGPRTNCNSLPFTSRVWGVKLDGRCLDISDLEPAPACEMYKGATDGVLFFKDDGKCDMRNFLGSAGPQSDCSRLPISSRVWGVSIGGVCIDVSDAEAETACALYQNRKIGVSFYHDDGKCDESSYLGSVGPYSDCNALPFSNRVWGVQQNGQCLDISDLDPSQACLMYQNGMLSTLEATRD